MRRKRMMWALVFSAILTVTAGFVGAALASAPSGFTSTTIARGSFGPIDASNMALREIGDSSPAKDLWLSMQKTKGPSDLYIQSNVWTALTSTTPLGSTGWHTHPGHSLIIVTEGAVTAYDGNDPSCTPAVYTAPMGFVDEGGDHVHLLRNEGSVVAKTMTVQLIPAGATRRIDAPNPGHCPF